MSNLDIFFKRETVKEFHFIYLSPEEYRPLIYKQNTADKINAIAEKNDKGELILENGCLVIKLEKNYSFTNYQTVLNKTQNVLRYEAQVKLLEVIQWLLTEYPDKIKDAETAQTLIFSQAGRDKWLTDSKIKDMADYLYCSPENLFDPLVDITYLFSERYPDLNWSSKNTKDLPSEILIKFNDYIENEKSGWSPLLEVNTDSKPEQLGEFSGKNLEPRSITLHANSEGLEKLVEA